MPDELRERVTEAVHRALVETSDEMRARGLMGTVDATVFDRFTDAAIAAYEAARPDAVQERTDWLYRHLCDALAVEPVSNPTHHDWDVAVARVRRLAEARPTEPDPATIEKMARALFELDWEGDPEITEAIWGSEREAWGARALAAWRAEHDEPAT